MVWIGKVMENGVVMVCERKNGRCEFTKFNEIRLKRDMKHFMPMRKKTLGENYVRCNLSDVTKECLIKLNYN
jgi:hypothetical protein